MAKAASSVLADQESSLVCSLRTKTTLYEERLQFTINSVRWPTMCINSGATRTYFKILQRTLSMMYCKRFFYRYNVLQQDTLSYDTIHFFVIGYWYYNVLEYTCNIQSTIMGFGVRTPKFSLLSKDRSVQEVISGNRISVHCLACETVRYGNSMLLQIILQIIELFV